MGIAKQLPASCLLALQLLQIGSHTVGEWKEPVAAVGFRAIRVQQNFPMITQRSLTLYKSLHIFSWDADAISDAG